MTKNKMKRKERADARINTNTPQQQQLTKLDERFGKNQGAKKERAKLMQKLNT